MRHFRNKNYLIQDDYATVHSSYATQLWKTENKTIKWFAWQSKSGVINIIKNVWKNASSDIQNIQNCQLEGLITNVKEMPHYFNILFRVYALQSQTDLDKSIDPKVMQLNRRDRKVSFKKLFRVYVFQATLRLLFYNKRIVN